MTTNHQRKGEKNVKNNTITIRDLKETGIRTWSKKDDSPRGCETVYINDLSVGDKVVIDNHFVEIVETKEIPS